MSEKRTDELEDALGKTHAADFRDYLSENKDSLLSLQNSFSMYIKDIIHRSHLTQQTVFLMADIPERYGYKLLSGEKRTRRRDIILRICYAAQLTLDETQRALEKYGMPRLYPKIPRDALLCILFSSRPGSLQEVDEALEKEGFSPLEPCGEQE
ncbi:MAG: hypothetical protein LKG56_04805 [Lachnospiraceae bacterium]|jgi:hypothetical protein|nr:hypothetical protein [Lachnospiraceae bacterium]MCH4029967.1 hypothetical protein [Lachnospiraceae bacterium]MCH4070372.1 hypothetical protein [Lachnospiraceae bacterium]MCI1331599.1 hypothetical protein [Lachnospiraceae bacterium]MCI1361022.1 hypothetical protein [Lachnospiraceae bacterium]